MNVYKIDTGIIYHVAANNLGEAVAVAWEEFHGCDDPEAIEDTGLRIDKLDRKNWPKTYYDDGEGKDMSFPDLVKRTTSPGILTCSEL